MEFFSFGRECDVCVKCVLGNCSIFSDFSREKPSSASCVVYVLQLHLFEVCQRIQKGGVCKASC